MFTPILFAGLIASGISMPAPVDLAAIPRVIKKEHVYEGKPRYALLVFGKKADTRVWLVLDDRRLYIDRNGNGDLTDPGETVGRTGEYVNVDQIVERDGAVHRFLQIQTLSNGTFILRIGQPGKRQQFVGVDKMERPTWGDKPENAPIIHFNGPMSFERYGPMIAIPRGQSYGRRLSLQLMLGTPGLGKGAFASYDEICTEDLGPITADIVYSRAVNFEMFEQRIELLHDG